MYAATSAYLKNFILQNFAFYNFSKYLDCQPLQKNWATLELEGILHETDTLTSVLRKNVVIVIFNKFCLILHLTFTRILVFSP